MRVEKIYVLFPHHPLVFNSKPQSHSFALDSLGPGYRWVELYDNGRINTGVRRSKNFYYDIKNTTSGY